MIQVGYAGHFEVGHSGESHSGDCPVGEAIDGYSGVDSEINDGVSHASELDLYILIICKTVSSRGASQL